MFNRSKKRGEMEPHRSLQREKERENMGVKASVYYGENSYWRQHEREMEYEAAGCDTVYRAIYKHNSKKNIFKADKMLPARYGYLRFRQWEKEAEYEASKFTINDGNLYNDDYPFLKGNTARHPQKRYLLHIICILAPIYKLADRFEDLMHEGWLLPSREKINIEIVQHMAKRTNKFTKKTDGSWTEVKDYETPLRKYISNRINKLEAEKYSFEEITQRIKEIDPKTQGISVSQVIYGFSSLVRIPENPSLLGAQSQPSCLNYVLTPKECQKLIQLTHLRDGEYYTKEGKRLKIIRRDIVQNNERCGDYFHVHSTYLAKMLYNIIISYLTDYPELGTQFSNEIINSNEGYAVGFHDVFQIFQFFPGSSVDSYEDISGKDRHGRYCSFGKQWKKSDIAMYFYLNTNFQGGNIVLDDNSNDAYIPFQKGSVLSLPSGTFHKETTVKSGFKYVLRASLLHTDSYLDYNEAIKNFLNTPREEFFSDVVIPPQQQSFGRKFHPTDSSMSVRSSISSLSNGIMQDSSLLSRSTDTNKSLPSDIISKISSLSSSFHSDNITMRSKGSDDFLSLSSGASISSAEMYERHGISVQDLNSLTSAYNSTLSLSIGFDSLSLTGSMVGSSKSMSDVSERLLDWQYSNCSHADIN